MENKSDEPIPKKLEQGNPATEKEKIDKLVKSLKKAYSQTSIIEQYHTLIEGSRENKIPLEFYFRIFEIYSLQESENEYLKNKWLSTLLKLKKKFDPLVRILASLGSLTVFFGVLTFVCELPQRIQQRSADIERTNYTAWDIIRNSQGQTASFGRIEAIQHLASNKVSLEGLDVQKALLDNIKIPKAYLRLSNFSEASLVSSNFSEANLERAKMHAAQFRSSHLKKTNFYHADLSNSFFDKADLTGADLTETNLSSTNLEKARLKDVKTQNAIYDNKTKFPKDFNPTIQKMIKLAPYANLSGLKLDSFDLSYNDLKNADLSKTFLYKSDLKYSQLNQANLSGADMRYANLTKVNLSGANLSGANLFRADLSEADLSGANFNSANLSGAIICTTTNTSPALTPKQLKTTNQNCKK
jgi:uncharacterized protein YjbI with pentapeptide repeats